MISLGRQPISNDFRSTGSNKVYDLDIDLNGVIPGLLTLKDWDGSAPSPKQMFNSSYVYDSSKSKSMREHFEATWTNLEANCFPNKGMVLEIGANSGEFLKHVKEPNRRVAVEPCKNWANHLITNDRDWETICF